MKLKASVDFGKLYYCSNASGSNEGVVPHNKRIANDSKYR